MADGTYTGLGILTRQGNDLRNLLRREVTGNSRTWLVCQHRFDERGQLFVKEGIQRVVLLRIGHLMTITEVTHVILGPLKGEGNSGLCVLLQEALVHADLWATSLEEPSPTTARPACVRGDRIAFKEWDKEERRADA